MNRLSLTTFSIHEQIGIDRRAALSPEGTEMITSATRLSPKIQFLDMPQAVKSRGIDSLDLCFIHLPETDDRFLSSLKESLTQADLNLFCLIMDVGNLTRPPSVHRETELAWMAQWINKAAELGATNIRVQAGDADPNDPQALKQAADAYLRLADFADEAGIRLLTENFGDFTRSADTLLALLDRVGDRIGLVADFGNGRQPGDFDDLKKLLPRAQSVHAKPHVYPDGRMDEEDFRTCIRLAEESGYTGPYTIVYRGPGDPWEGIERTRDIILDELN